MPEENLQGLQEIKKNFLLDSKFPDWKDSSSDMTKEYS